ncbi:MAG: hypothetical protein ACE367_24070 [Acidimicrobiales bacterium]
MTATGLHTAASDARSATSAASTRDQHLLKRHAPILCLDARELFRPCAVEGYVQASTLVDGGTLVDGVRADALDERWSSGTYLRFVAEAELKGPLSSEARRIARRVRSSRLGLVGLFARFLDALFQLSVWIRPCTPRRTAAAAAAKADELGLHAERVTYGRVVRAGEWVVLHYAWFYVMNDWRTSYRGLNDHEADWEQAWIYCDPATDRPIWVATTNHELRGADLRRHWDDPEVDKRGNRPVLYVAAGSHAMFFRPGDYVTTVDVPSLRWALRARSFVRRTLALPDVEPHGPGPVLGVPFIDSAGGDGEVVRDAELRCLASPAWADRYRGLWGLDTGDPLQGERGPSGPKFDRRGEVRPSWADPLGMAGLHGTPPPSAMARRVNLDKIDMALEELDTEVRRVGRLLPLLRQSPSAKEMDSESARMTELLRQRTELADLRQRIELGQLRHDELRDHLRRPAAPLPDATRGRWVVGAWAALTVPALLACLGLVVISDRIGVVTVALVAIGVVVPMEQLAHGRVATALRVALLEAVAVLIVVFALGEATRIGSLVFGAASLSAALALFFWNLAELWAIRRTTDRG